MDEFDFIPSFSYDPFTEDTQIGQMPTIMPPREGVSNVRFMHASPKAPPVDIFINGQLMVRALEFGEVSDYKRIPAGVSYLRVVPSSNPTRPVIDTIITTLPGAYNMIAIVAVGNTLRPFTINEPIFRHTKDFGYVRFVNLSPDAGPVDVSLRNGRLVFNDVEYLAPTNYAAFREGTFTFRFTQANQENPFLIVPGQTTKGGRFQTIYLLGLLNDKPQPFIVATTDPNTYV